MDNSDSSTSKPASPQQKKKTGKKTAKRTNPKSRLRERRFRAIPASHGVIMGTAIVIRQEATPVLAEQLPPEQIHHELKRFSNAVASCANELETVLSMAQETIPHSVAAIIESQILILKDFTVNESIMHRIGQGISAERAIIEEFDAQQQILYSAKDSFLRERAVELEHIKQRLLAHLRQKKLISSVPKNSILVTPSLTPSEIMLYNESGMSGFITEISGIASHMSILARSLHIPAVIGLRNATKYIDSGTPLIVDGYAGVIIANPRPETVAKYIRRKSELDKKEQKYGKIAKLPSQTTDGRKIHLHANIDTVEDIDTAIASGANGIGLVRTEHLIIKLNRFPTEEEQVRWYSELAERAYPLPVTIRAFDVGSDKTIDALSPEANPALGLRGIRLLMKHKELFASQIRAVLRASHHRNIRLMLPMITSLSELQKARTLIEKCKNSLRKEGLEFDASTPIGVMIETPSAALMARELGALADFFSIGTNDLTQYTLAADRLNPSVANIYDALHPAVLRLLKLTVDAARYHNIPVGVCGEVAGHAAATELLLGLGMVELSVVPPLLPELKKRIRKTSYASSVLLANEVLQYNSGSEIRKRIAVMKKK